MTIKNSQTLVSSLIQSQVKGERVTALEWFPIIQHVMLSDWAGVNIINSNKN